jgi:Uma2 family endonuclease
MNQPTLTRMTAAEFFDLPETTQPTELLDGELIVSPAPVPQHQSIVMHIIGVLLPITNAIGGKLFSSPIDVYLDDTNVAQPDLVWVAPDSGCAVTSKRLQGAPDLVVEVFSPGTERRDRGYKYDLYQRYGVREYWMVSPEGQYIEVCRLEAGQFWRVGLYGPDTPFESPLLGSQSIDTAQIFSA